jgi:hypothetical protein
MKHLGRRGGACWALVVLVVGALGPAVARAQEKPPPDAPPKGEPADVRPLKYAFKDRFLIGVALDYRGFQRPALSP